MRLFNKFPEELKCAICKTNENKPCVLQPILGGNNMEAAVVHQVCMHRWATDYLHWWHNRAPEVLTHGLRVICIGHSCIRLGSVRIALA